MSIQYRVTCEYGVEKIKRKKTRYICLSLAHFFFCRTTHSLNDSTHYKTENKTATTNHLHITHSPFSFSFISTFSYYTISDRNAHVDKQSTRICRLMPLFLNVYLSCVVCFFLLATEFITLRDDHILCFVFIWQTIKME